MAQFKIRKGEAINQPSATQLRPHNHLSLVYIPKDKKYDDLTLAEFKTSYAGILQLPNLSSPELSARIDHLSSLMYLATQFSRFLVRSFHTVDLFEIEHGWANWDDSFTLLEASTTDQTAEALMKINNPSNHMVKVIKDSTSNCKSSKLS